MSSVSAVTYDAYGPRDTGLSSGPQSPASSAETFAPAQAVKMRAAVTGAGTLEDVVAANVAARASADVFSTPSAEYSDAMARAVRTAANGPKLGEHLDSMM